MTSSAPGRLRLIGGACLGILVFGPLTVAGLWFAFEIQYGSPPFKLLVAPEVGIGLGLAVAFLGGLFLWQFILELRRRLGAEAASASLVIRSNEDREGLAGYWMLSVFWLLMVGTQDYYFATLPYRVHVQLWLVAVLCFMTLVGFGLLALAVWKTLQKAKFGTAELQLAAHAAPGGSLSARLLMPPSANEAEALFGELVATRLTIRIEAGEERPEAVDVWSQKRNFPVHRDGRRRYAALRFDLPPDAPPTTVPAHGLVRSYEPGEYVYWQLKVTAVLSGVDFARTFDIRVKAGVQA